MGLKGKILLACCAAAILSGCIGPKVNVSRNPAGSQKDVATIALMPSGGLLADAVGVELLQYGYNIIDTSQVTGYMARYNLDEIELLLPKNIRRLSDDGIDTVLIVRAVAGYDDRPESATSRLVSTSDGVVIVGASWQNGRAGAQGSPADGFARKNLSDAAHDIAEAIGEA